MKSIKCPAPLFTKKDFKLFINETKECNSIIRQMAILIDAKDTIDNRIDEIFEIINTNKNAIRRRITRGSKTKPKERNS